MLERGIKPLMIFLVQKSSHAASCSRSVASIKGLCLLFFATAALLLAPAPSFGKTKVDIFTSNEFPLLENLTKSQSRDFVVVVYNLDVANDFIKDLNVNVGDNRIAAETELNRLFPEQAVPGQPNLRQKMLDLAQGENLARQYGIKKYPAVVFNEGKEVVYGVVDITQAINLYLEYMKNK